MLHYIVLHCIVLYYIILHSETVLRIKWPLLYLLMGSIVRSLETRSLPAELIFFHTDLPRVAQHERGLCRWVSREGN